MSASGGTDPARDRSRSAPDAPGAPDATRPAPGPPPDVLLAERVFAGGRSKPFAEVTRAEVEERAQELRSATGWGPTARVASVALAWRELAVLMADSGAQTVGELDPEELAQRAQKLWIVPPGGSLLL
jgi:hypothetical protein